MNFSEFYQTNYFYIIYFVSFYIIYKLTTWRFTLADEIGIRGPTPIPLFGNMFEYMKHGFHVRDMENQKKYGDIYPIYMGQVPTLIVTDLDALKQILIKDAKSFNDRPVFTGASKLMKKGVEILKGKDWERVRALLTPIFTSGKLKQMSPILIDSVHNMMDRLKKAETVPIDVKRLFESVSMDGIAKAMFGIEINVKENNTHEFITHTKNIFDLSTSGLLFAILSIFPQIGELIDYFFPEGLNSSKSEIYMVDTLKKTIEARRQGKMEYKDMLALMIKAHEEPSQENQNPEDKSNNISYAKLTEEEIMAQSIAFLFAGYETTGTLLTFCAYYLSKNPNDQEEIYEELMECLGNEKEITYDALTKLNLLDQFINESLRMYAPIIRFGRICNKDTEVTTSTNKKIVIKKGTEIIIAAHAIHHDERLWTDPERFDMHRFDKNDRPSRNALSFMPFGMGPRNCIGMRFAVLGAKLTLANIIKNYQILPCDQPLKILSFDAIGFIKLKDPLFIGVKKR